MGSDQDRRAMLAILLSLAVYLLWSSMYGPPPPEPPPEEAVVEGVAAPEEEAEAPATPEVAEAPVAEVVPDHAEPLSGEGWRGVVHSANGAVRELVMTDYDRSPEVTPLTSWLLGKVTGTAEGPWEPYRGGDVPEQILTGEGALVIAGSGAFDDDGAGRADDPSVYRVERAGDAVRATRRRPGGLVVEKRYTPGDGPHAATVEVRFRNTGATAIDGLWIGVADHMTGKAGRFMQAPRPVVFADGDVEHVLDTEELVEEGPEEFTGPVEWFGMGNRYFMAALVPLDGPAGGAVVTGLPSGRTGVFIRDPRPLGPGEERVVRFLAWLGPKDLELLKPLGHSLDKSVEFGIFGFFSKPLLLLLRLLHGLVGSWGLAIVLLTVLVKLVFFPLTQKAFVSSRKMQAIQPQLQELKERYKDNRELQTQETMKLMQEHGVNPMGGCLPTLIQLPVWFALYSTMLYSVELYGRSFLYLQDLTAADPYAVLPLLYIGLMLLQQRMMPMTGMDPTQARIFKLMPLFFGFIMFGFPSGLVLYFCVNMLLTIIQQWFIRRQYPAEPTAA